jgi:hypothetical protein
MRIASVAEKGSYRGKAQMQNEIDLQEAMSILDVPEQILGRLIEEGKLRARRTDSNLYFLRDEIEALVARQVDEVIAADTDDCAPPENSAERGA